MVVGDRHCSALDLILKWCPLMAMPCYVCHVILDDLIRLSFGIVIWFQNHRKCPIISFIKNYVNHVVIYRQSLQWRWIIRKYICLMSIYLCIFDNNEQKPLRKQPNYVFFVVFLYYCIKPHFDNLYQASFWHIVLRLILMNLSHYFILYCISSA